MSQWKQNLQKALGYLALSATLFSGHAVADMSKTETVTAQEDWYLHLDVQALRNSALAIHVANKEASETNLFKAFLDEEIIDSVRYISFRGYLNQDDNKVMLVEGAFDSKNNRTTLASKLADLGFDVSSIENGTIYQSDTKSIIEHLRSVSQQVAKQYPEDAELQSMAKDMQVKIDFEDKDNKPVYLAFKSPTVIVASDNSQSVKHWLNTESQWTPTIQSNVFEVVVDVQKSLAHGGVNLNKESNDFQFESISAKQLSQVSGKYSENDGMVDIQVGLKTDSYDTATQIEAIVKGLLALKVLSNSNPEITRLLSNVQIERGHDSLTVSLSGPVESFKSLSNNMH